MTVLGYCAFPSERKMTTAREDGNTHLDKRKMAFSAIRQSKMFQNQSALLGSSSIVKSVVPYYCGPRFPGEFSPILHRQTDHW